MLRTSDLGLMELALEERIAYVLVRGAVEPRGIAIVGDEPEDRVGDPPLWPSDHAGVAAALRLPHQRR